MARKYTNAFALSLVGVVFFITAAFTWPWEGNQTQQKPQSNSEAPSKSETSVSPPIKAVRKEKLRIQKSQRAVSVAPKKEIKEQQSEDASNGESEDERDGKEDREVARLKRKINEITRMNQAVRTQNQAQTIEIQKIVENARAHQQILQNLEILKSNTTYQPSQTDELLRQQKIRLIQEQTNNNLNAIQSFKPLPMVATPVIISNAQPSQISPQPPELHKVFEPEKNNH